MPGLTLLQFQPLGFAPLAVSNDAGGERNLPAGRPADAR